ncbi:hypothetical protein JVU11DRAFT_11381 [Chiua virens]|nr:hypothetical protein JVU11DRAFT_11381 [Chiua virens]
MDPCPHRPWQTFRTLALQRQQITRPRFRSSSSPRRLLTFIRLFRNLLALDLSSSMRLGQVYVVIVFFWNPSPPKKHAGSVWARMKQLPAWVAWSAVPLATLPPARTSGPHQRKITTTDALSLSNVLSPNSANRTSDSVVLINMENKMLAYYVYSGVFERGVQGIVSAWGVLFMYWGTMEQCVDTDCVTRLSEKLTGTKLALLYEKYLYSLALSFAYTQNLDTTDVHRHHGDYLYENLGDYEGAMKKYLQTISGVRGSYVVQKTLSFAAREELSAPPHSIARQCQEKERAKNHRSILTLQFVFVDRQVSLSKLHTLQGDREDTKTICGSSWKTLVREAMIPRQGKIENGHREAVGYLREVGGAAAESNLTGYCCTLLDNLPNETTQITYRPMHHFRAFASFGESSGASTKIVRAALDCEESRRQRRRKDLTTALASGPGKQSLTTHAWPASGLGTQTPPGQSSPTLSFAHFMDHPECFMETVALRWWGQALDERLESDVGAVAAGEDEEAEEQDQVAVWSTLLELYLATNIPRANTTKHSDCSIRPISHAISRMRWSSARLTSIRLD